VRNTENKIYNIFAFFEKTLEIQQKTMATEEEPVEETENDDDSKGNKSKKHDSGAADLEKVTDYVEETEISGQSIGDVSTTTCCIIYKES